jgi:hypothetical protein
MQTTTTNPDAGTPPSSFFLRHHRLSEMLLILTAPVAVFTGLAPIGLALQLSGWVVLFAVLYASARLDRAMRQRGRVHTPGLVLPRAGGPAAIRRPYPGATFPSSLGPFNTQNGLDLSVSPESITDDAVFADVSICTDAGDRW